MDDEFKLCWKNFQDNIASGFQNLYDRGDLVDVTLACDGKLLHAHKIVLAICSPYFQEIFITNPCKHPIIILKDVTFNIMCELLEFMYQGVVNVKHTELQSFMKIGQLLQIKGLATNPSSSTASSTSDKSIAQTQNAEESNNACLESGASNNAKNNNSDIPNNVECSTSTTNKSLNMNASSNIKTHSPPSSPTPLSFTSPLTQQNCKTSHDSNTSLHHSYHGGAGYKRHSDFSSDALSIYSRKQLRRSLNALDHSSEHNDNSEPGSSMDQVNAEDFFLSSIPHISMVEPRYDLNNVKRESEHLGSAAGPSSSLRNSFGPAFGFDYNLYKNSSGASSGTTGYPNELHMPNDYSKNFGNHMDIPPNGSNVVMLSSTSLLHGNCVFNRNNTVATQQGMKTYWLCKSYRISMCRARCITHQGRVISATGSHNHPPHMRNSNSNGNSTTSSVSVYNTNADGPASVGVGQSPISAGVANGNVANNLIGGANANINASSLRLPQTSATSNMYQHNILGPNGQPHHQQQQLLPPPLPPPQTPVSPVTPNTMVAPHSHGHHLAPESNLLAQQHSLHLTQHPNDGLQGTHSQHVPPPVPNSVIHNMMHNANIMHLSNMPHMLHVDPNQHSVTEHSPHHSEQQHHHQHPHQQRVGSNLEITRLIESSPNHMQSPSNRSNQSHHGGNSLSSPLPAGTGSGAAPTIDSPIQANISEDAHIGGEKQVLVPNTALSPAEMNSNTGSSAEVSGSTQSDANNDGSHQAHVINYITISPGNHNFKIENM